VGVVGSGMEVPWHANPSLEPIAVAKWG
jgi:hypothetical protein